MRLLGTLAKQGRMHVVGAVLEPIPVPAIALISGQRDISGSPTGSPVDIARMLAFAARHDIRPQTEKFPMAKVNEALQHLCRWQGTLSHRAGGLSAGAAPCAAMTAFAPARRQLLRVPGTRLAGGHAPR